MSSGIEERTVSRAMRKLFVGRSAAPPKPRRDLMDISFVRAWVWPVLLILWTCPTSLLIPMAVYHYGGSVLRVVNEASLLDMASLLPRPSVEAGLVLLGWSLFQGLLLEFLPGRVVHGPVTPTGEKPEYVDNGIAAWAVTHAAWFVLGPLTGALSFARVYDLWGSMIATANLFAVPFCMFLYWKGRNYPSTRDAVWTGRAAFDFFQGIELHPRLFGLNVKQLLNCRISMMGWSVSQLCFAQAQAARGELSNGMLLLATLHVLYLAKFFWWESGYFASIDIIHDRCGYYIVWGVLVWVPSAYCAPGFALVEHPARWSAWGTGVAFAVGIASLLVNYAADHQRQAVRETHGACLVWGRKPNIITAKYRTSDGAERTSILLCSGFWGLSRHFNYIPELVLAMTWSMPANAQLALPWVYWLFLFFLLVDRADRDDAKCREKYGPHWTQYCKRVPYRIVPYVY